MRGSPRGRKPVVLAVAVLIAGATIGVMGASGAAVPAGVISGRVTGADTGGGLSGICVDALPPGKSLFDPGTTFVTTGPQGFYSFTGLDVGTSYRLFFSDCNQPPRYAGQYWPDQPFGPGEAVTAPQAGVNATLSVGATIEGTVSQESEFNNGSPIQDACVNTLPSLPTQYGQTDSKGHFEIPLLPAGTYTVDFGCGFGWEGSQGLKDWWWNDKATQSSADSITLSPGQVFVANEQLPAPGVLQGQVTDAHTGAPLSNVCVTITKQDGTYVSSIVTTSSGTWELEQLPMNLPLVVEFNGGLCGTNPAYVPQWWNDKHSLGQADPITFGKSDPVVSGIDAQLTPST